MIDRKTAITSVALIALMLMAAVWRVFMPNGWTANVVQPMALRLSLWLFCAPACGAFVVGRLYFVGPRRADEAKVQPWRKWAMSLSIRYCGVLLLLQSVLIIQSLGLGTSLNLMAIGRAVAVLSGIVCLLAFNQMPKLPWYERRFAPGGDLGPIYGPRFVRTQSRIATMLAIAMIIFVFASPWTTGWRPVPYFLLANALIVVWSIGWRFHLARKWKAERLGGAA